MTLVEDTLDPFVGRQLVRPAEKSVVSPTKVALGCLILGETLPNSPLCVLKS